MPKASSQWPASWLEFRHDGTAQRRTGHWPSGTWMDPEDAQPRRALVWYAKYNQTYRAYVHKQVTTECLYVWEGTIRVNKKTLHGCIYITDTGYEFKEDS